MKPDHPLDPRALVESNGSVFTLLVVFGLAGSAWVSLQEPRTQRSVASGNPPWTVHERSSSAPVARNRYVHLWFRGGSVFASLRPDPAPGESRSSSEPSTGSPRIRYTHHRVQSGETLSEIAGKYDLSLETLLSANDRRLRDHSFLPVGMTLRIPNRDGVLTRLQPGQTLWHLKQSYGVDPGKILRLNGLQSPRHLRVGQSLFIPGARPKPGVFPRGVSSSFSWPIRGAPRRITSRFGMRIHPVYDTRRLHKGIDFGARRGTRVFASRAGRVMRARRWSTYGRVVRLRHWNGFQTLYSHLGRIFVDQGQYVRRGQLIGAVGSSGLTTGPNLHFELRSRNQPVNPRRYLPSP